MGDTEVPINSDVELYHSRFDPQTYLGYCYQFAECPGQRDNSRFVTFVLYQMSQTFATGKYKGKRLIEVGSGPTIHTLISACEHFEEIVMSDFVDNNRRELEKWLRADQGCFNWDAHIQLVCDLEGRRTPAAVSEVLRQRVKQVLRCDITLENPFHPVTVEPADCIISSLCLEAACRNRDTYQRSLGTLVGLLRDGGTLVLIGDLNETFYTVGTQRFSIVNLSQDFIRQTLEELGMSVVQFTLQQAIDRELNQKCDCEASFYLVAEKKL